MQYMLDALFAKRQATTEPKGWAGTVGSSTYYLRPAESGNTPSPSTAASAATNNIFKPASQAQSVSAPGSPANSPTSQQQQAWTPSPTPSPAAETKETWQAPASTSTPWTPSPSPQEDTWKATPTTPTQNDNTWQQAVTSTSAVLIPASSSSNMAASTINTAIFSAAVTDSAASGLLTTAISIDGLNTSVAGVDANSAAAAQTAVTADSSTPVFSKLSKPAIAGIVAAMLVLLAIAVGVGIFWKRKRGARDDDSMMEILTTTKGGFRDDASIASFGPAHNGSHGNGGFAVFDEKGHRRSRQDADAASVYSADGDIGAERPTSEIYMRPGMSPRQLTPEYSYDPANRPSFGWQRNNAFSSSSEHLNVQPAWNGGLDRSRSVRNVSGGLGPAAY